MPEYIFIIPVLYINILRSIDWEKEMPEYIVCLSAYLRIFFRQNERDKSPKLLSVLGFASWNFRL